MIFVPYQAFYEMIGLYLQLKRIWSKHNLVNQCIQIQQMKTILRGNDNINLSKTRLWIGVILLIPSCTRLREFHFLKFRIHFNRHQNNTKRRIITTICLKTIFC